jgi:selenocysteine lyase/cysteine desulfurase
MIADIERIRASYSRFLRPGRILLSGHSHQAWPDVARDAQLEAFDDSAAHVDDKWERAVFPLVEEVGRGILARMGCPSGDAIAFAESTHALLVRLLSAFDHRELRVVTTTSEFHSLDRQLRRYAEGGLRVLWVDAQSRMGLAERLVEAIEGEARAGGPVVVAFSAVIFEDAWVMHEIASVLEACERVGAISVVDAYHAFNAVPLDWGPALRSAFIVSGGYKYAGFGNGLCWMRLPEHTELRPADTGWFADFDALAAPRVVDGVLVARPVGYGQGAARFAGATFEASAFYRARAVLRHWDALGLGVAELRALYVAQTRLILDGLTARRVLGEGRPLERVSADEDARRGAFVSVRHPNAGGLSAALRERGIWTDSRGMNLRLGPAPYVLDAEIERALDVLADLVR